MTNELSVWLYGIEVARVNNTRGRLRLEYTEEAFASYQLGTPLLSLSMPLTRERYSHGVVRRFIDGLLPEGEARAIIARDNGIRADDTFALITELGRDCAGALVFQPAAESAPRAPTTLSAERLSRDELAQLVLNLRSAPLGAGGRVRVSLAGVQEKLLLTRLPERGWGRPVDGTPSTHILKPEIAAYPKTVENEAFCMRFAAALGLRVANIETTSVNQRKLIVVERFDRVVEDDGSVTRIHQEDLCQAFGLGPDQKYQDDGGPSLRRIAELLQLTVGSESLRELLEAVACNVLVGNGDAHAKNFSILHLRSGELQLAPLYDVMSTSVYGDDRLAMYIDDVHRIERVSGDRLLNEAESWGMSRPHAHTILSELLGRVERAASLARRQTRAFPNEIMNLLEHQAARLAS